MIRRFRIEGESSAPDKEALISELAEAVAGIISETRRFNGHSGTWECTQDVITGASGNWKGRMVLVYRSAN